MNVDREQEAGMIRLSLLSWLVGQIGQWQLCARFTPVDRPARWRTVGTGLAILH